MFKFDLNVKHGSCFFKWKTWSTEKNTVQKNNMKKIIELHVVHTCRHMKSE